jgi:hypothetical protein
VKEVCPATPLAHARRAKHKTFSWALNSLRSAPDNSAVSAFHAQGICVFANGVKGSVSHLSTRRKKFYGFFAKVDQQTTESEFLEEQSLSYYNQDPAMNCRRASE